jgi:uncharacterized protein YfaS (alpha-2-macroglobulin family)
MEYFKRLILCLAALLALPVVAQQDEGAAFFSLSSDRTFSPGEAPTVQLWGQGFRKLQFRLYRVNDPVAFFEKLEEDHHFGGRPPRRDSNLTPLERFRAWKLRQRMALRNLVRAQFTLDARREYVASQRAGEQAPPPKASPAKPSVDEYAGVPVLNPQQLVATWDQPFAPANRWESAQVPIPAKEKGLYLVEATNGKLSAHTIVSVTGMAIISKGAPGRLLLRTVERASGKPVTGVPVRVLSGGSGQRDKLGAGETDNNGFLEVKIGDQKPESLLLLARQGTDFAALSTYGGNVTLDNDQRLHGYVYTDRPVYRPGHTVHYRAIVRSREVEGYQVPSGRRAKIEIQDSEGKSIYRTEQSLSSLGTLNGRFPIPANAALGYYSVQLQIGESYHAGGFQVEEYKKPEYEVRVVPTTKRVVQGGSLQMQIEARYYYGEPVANAKVKWTVHRGRYYLPYYLDDLDEDSGSTEDGDSPYSQREQVSEESGELDSEGKLTVNVPTAATGADQRYRVEAHVTDAAGREISGAGFAIATVGSYFVHVESDRYVYTPGQQASFTVDTRDYDNNPVPNVAFTVELLEWRWKEGEGSTVGQVQGVTGADGKGRVALPVTSGSLRVRVRSKTREGRQVEDYDYIWVSGNASWMSRGPDQRIQVVADKKTYQAGDTAKLLIMAGEPGAHLWVTLEGRSVLKSHFLTAADGTVSVDVPIEAVHAPNIWITAVAMSKNRLVQGTKMIKVPPVQHQLAVDLKPSKPEFRPGEPAAYLLEAKDSAGRPVANAEFSVGVVDEAIYAIRPEAAPEILPYFYGREWNRVNTDTSLSYYFHGEAGKRRMQLARVRPFRPNAQLKPDRMVQPKIRRLFPDTAFWSAEVRTDSAGKAQVKLEFPDALTTWRATARGVTADTKVGGTVNRVIVRKNLLTRLAVPRFFRQGDTMTIRVITQNLLPREKKVEVSLDAKGLQVIEGGKMQVTIAPKQTHVADYRVKVPSGKEAILLAKALTDEESDALELTLPIIPFGVKMADVRGGSFAGQTSESTADITIPTNAEPGSGSLEITATSSVAGSMFDALEYLTSFPYGCTEQTMSSFLPNVVVSQAVKSLGLKDRVNEVELNRKVRAGLERLGDFQHEDGGWGWWKTDESDVFMTAYVVAGLSQGRAAGQKVDWDWIQRGAEWLRTNSAKVKKTRLDLQAYVEYALALSGTPAAQLDELYAQRGNMSGYSLALLGLALDARKDQRAAAIATALEAKVKTSETEAWWPSERDDLLDIEMDSTPEASAYAMKLLASQNPENPLLAKAAVYLVNHRSGGYYWNSTKQTAMVIFGLTDYMKASGELKPNFSVTVFVNDQPSVTKRFTESEALSPATVKVPTSQLKPGVNRVRVVRYGQGRVYWSARGEYYSSADRLAQRGNLQLNLEREYFRLSSVKQGEKLVYNLEPMTNQVAQGDVIAVRLTVTGNHWRYLMVEDPIPAGTEIVERDDLYEIRQKPAWWNYYFTRREFRDDRAAFFQTWFERDQRYFYLLKVVNPGQFRVSPARVEPMYQPQYFATSSSLNLEVTK